MKVHITGFKIYDVPAGRYFLGDPCYTIDAQEDWMELLESCNFFIDNPIGTLKGELVVSFGTAYGDGVYLDQFGGVYSVDAGMIGAVPEALWDFDEAHLATLGRIVEFKDEWQAERDSTGTITLGMYRINTDGEGY